MVWGGLVGWWEEGGGDERGGGWEGAAWSRGEEGGGGRCRTRVVREGEGLWGVELVNG